MRSVSKLLISALIIIFINPLFSQSNETDEFRSAITEADGYVFLSEDMRLKDIRKEAIERSKQDALEKAQVYIKSFTKIENFVLEYDLVFSEAEGYVKILESKDYGIESDNRYHYWIKAEVQYLLKKPTKDIPVDVATNPKAPLTISVWTEKSEYRQGEMMRIFLRGNKDFYTKVVYQNASGETLQLLPNQHRADNFINGNYTVMIPDEPDNFNIEVEPPFGKEKIIVYASSSSLGNAKVIPYGKDLFHVDGNLEGYSKMTRGVRITGREKDDQAAEFYEANCTVITKSVNH